MAYLPKLGITHDEALADLHGVDTVSGAAPFKGYELYVALARRILLLWPLYPILLTGRYLGGRALYRMIADRRIRWFGVCQMPTTVADSGTAATEWPKLAGVRDPIAIATLHVTGLAAIFILATPLPYVGSPSPQHVFGGRVERALTTIADAAFTTALDRSTSSTVRTCGWRRTGSPCRRRAPTGHEYCCPSSRKMAED